MPWIQRLVAAIQSILETGAMRLTNWLVGSGRNRSSAISELQQRYPDAPVENVTTVYESMVQANQAGIEMTGTGIHPPLSLVPLDPTIPPPATISYAMDVTGGIYTGGRSRGRPEKTKPYYMVYEATGEQTIDQLKEWAKVRLADLIRADTLPGIDSVETRVISADVEIISITRND